MRLLPLFAMLALAACSPQPPAVTHGEVRQLTITDTRVGTGVVATNGASVQVLYSGWLYDDRAPDKHGSAFDSSARHGNTPFNFTLGAGQVIPGWDSGVAGMRVGGERTLLIPASLGYGARGAGNAIPPNASLVFDVKLVGVD